MGVVHALLFGHNSNNDVYVFYVSDFIMSGRKNMIDWSDSEAVIYLFFVKGKTGGERGLAGMLPGNLKFINQDESCPGFGG